MTPTLHLTAILENRPASFQPADVLTVFDDAINHIRSLSDADLSEAFHLFVDLEARACECCQQTHSYAGTGDRSHADDQRARHLTLELRQACAAELMARRLHA